jgi:vacuolar-type H+-ATPase subunit H
MAKNVFHPVEIVDLTAQKVKVAAPVFVSHEPEPLDVYEGPTADDLRREAEVFKESWVKEKERLVQEAHEEAESIRKQAEKTAFDEVKSKTDSAIRDKRIAEDEAERIKAEAETEAELIRKAAADERDQVFAEARTAGFTEGREAGWKEGLAEAERLIERLHKILDAAIEKRQEIIDEAENTAHRSRAVNFQKSRQSDQRKPEERGDQQHRASPAKTQEPRRCGDTCQSGGLGPDNRTCQGFYEDGGKCEIHHRSRGFFSRQRRSGYRNGLRAD